MFLIAGLGNPGRQYEKTRHNMGFDTIDELIERHRIPQGGIAHKAMYGKGIISGEKVILAKPLTYMNLSGDSLREFVNYYKPRKRRKARRSRLCRYLCSHWKI